MILQRLIEIHFDSQSLKLPCVVWGETYCTHNNTPGKKGAAREISLCAINFYYYDLLKALCPDASTHSNSV